MLSLDHAADRPDEPDELAGNGGSHHARVLSAVDHLGELPVQALLCLPGNLGHAGGQGRQQFIGMPYFHSFWPHVIESAILASLGGVLTGCFGEAAFERILKGFRWW